MTDPQAPLAFVIEDDPDSAMIIARALKDAGFQPEIIPDGLYAIARLNLAIPALVALDMHMPQISGDRILQHIRAMPRLAETRVMIISSDDRLAGQLRHEVDLVLLKPTSFIQLRELAKRMRALLDA